MKNSVFKRCRTMYNKSSERIRKQREEPMATMCNAVGKFVNEGTKLWLIIKRKII